MNSSIAVLVSGESSNLQSLYWYGLDISVVVADRPCRAVPWAESKHIPTAFAQRSWIKLLGRDAYTDCVIDELEPYNPMLVVMAGFMTLLGPRIFERYPRRVLNMHNSWLPELKGMHAVEKALEEARDPYKRRSYTGCTLHVAEEEMDSERDIVVQKRVPVFADDSVQSLNRRIKTWERTIYPPAVAAYKAGLEEWKW